MTHVILSGEITVRSRWRRDLELNTARPGSSRQHIPIYLDLVWGEGVLGEGGRLNCPPPSLMWHGPLP